MAAEPSSERTASGIEALIARLHDEGVAAGRSEADRILAEAQATARQILEKAEAEARAKRDAAYQEAEGFRRAAEDALRAAARDTVLDLKERLASRFAKDVAKTVSNTMRDDEMLKQMILAVVGRARTESGVDQAAEVEVVLPRTAVGLDDLRRKPEELAQDSIARFVTAQAGDMLRAGVDFGRAEDGLAGLRLRLLDRGVSIDLTDQAVADALLAHMQPRFRALLEGVVK